MDMARYFPLFFVALWLVVTTVLAIQSGWFSLMSRYPDRREAPWRKLRWQSPTQVHGVRAPVLRFLVIQERVWPGGDDLVRQHRRLRCVATMDAYRAGFDRLQ